MKVRVFDAKSTEAAAAFAPQETPILGSRETGLVVQLGAAPGVVAYGDVAALAAFRSLETGSDRGYLLFFLAGRPRPLVAEAGHIRFDEFPIRISASGSENLRQVAIHLCRQADSMLVDRSTLAFMKSGGAPPVVERGMGVLATAFGRQLMPQASSAYSPHRTLPLPPVGAPPSSAPPPSAPPPASVAVGPAPISTQRRPAVPPGSHVRPGSHVPPAAPFPPATPPPAPPSRTPAPASPARQAFRPMEVQVFAPAAAAGDPSCQPHEVSLVGGSPRGLEISPDSVGRVAFEDVRGLAVFRSSETGAEMTFLMLVVQGPRPLLVAAGGVAFEEFPIRISASPPEDLRQLALYLCQKAGRMVMDKGTGAFLQRGGPAPFLEGRILALATAFRGALPPSTGGNEPTPSPPAGGETWGFSVASGPPPDDFMPSFTDEPAAKPPAASPWALEEAFMPLTAGGPAAGGPAAGGPAAPGGPQPPPRRRIRFGPSSRIL